MPQIIITTEDPGNEDAQEVHRERIASADVESETASHLLVERIGWALSDADEIERGPVNDPAAEFTRRRGSVADTAVH